MRLQLAGFAFLLVLCSEGSPYAQNGGRFVGTLTITGPRREEFKLKEDLAYIDPQGKKWDAPAGSKMDCASIPRVLWTLVGGPCEGDYLQASVIHDVYCWRGLNHKPGAEPWQETHRMFYDAMITDGVSKPYALLLYGAVYKFGPTWDEPRGWLGRIWGKMSGGDGPPPPPPPPVTEEDLKQLTDLMKASNPQTPEDVERLLDKPSLRR
jgi:uncharacterized protein DUF1353